MDKNQKKKETSYGEKKCAKRNGGLPGKGTKFRLRKPTGGLRETRDMVLARRHADKPLSIQARIFGYSQSNRAVDVPSSKAIANG